MKDKPPGEKSYDELLQESDEPFIRSFNEITPDWMPYVSDRVARLLVWGVLLVCVFIIIPAVFVAFGSVGAPGDSFVPFDAPGVDGEVVGSTGTGLLVDIDGDIVEVELANVVLASPDNSNPEAFDLPDEEEYHECVIRVGEDGQEYMAGLEGEPVSVHVHSDELEGERSVTAQVFTSESETVGMMMVEEGYAAPLNDSGYDIMAGQYESAQESASVSESGVWGCPSYGE